MSLLTSIVAQGSLNVKDVESITPSAFLYEPPVKSDKQIENELEKGFEKSALKLMELASVKSKL